MTAKSDRPASQRQLRVGEELRHVLARILARGELRDPALWNQMWQDARMRIISGDYKGPIFKDWNA